MRRPRLRAIARTAPVLAVTVAALGILTWPLLFTYSGFVGDWDHHLWLVWHQSLSIQADGLPSFFLHSSYSLFNPVFAFYGGTLYAITGLLALAAGPVQAYVLVYVLDFAAALGGWYWLGRMAGLSRWTALVPGLIFVTSTYYVVMVYVQGDWPEFTGVSMIAPMLAAALGVLRAERPRYRVALALAASSVVFFGSHNVTILLALTTLAITVLAVAILVPEARQQVTRRGVARVAAIVVPAAMVSAWYLLPATVYASRTRLGREYGHAHQSIETTAWLVSFKRLFTFSRTSGLGLPPPYYLAMALPVLAIVWVLLGIPILPRGNRNRTWTRVLLIFAGVTALVLATMTHVGLLLALPRPYTMIQFSYRLDIYVVLMLCASVLAALVLARTATRPVRFWAWLAVPVCAVSLLGVYQQLTSYPYPGQDRYATFESYGEVETGNNVDYQDNSERRIDAAKLPKLYFPLRTANGDSVSTSTNLPAGTRATTNIAAGAYLVKVTGATPIGIDTETDEMVVAIDPPHRGESSASAGGAQASTGAPAGEATITVSTGDSVPVVVGRVLTAFGLLLLAMQLLALPAYRFVSRRPHRVETS